MTQDRKTKPDPRIGETQTALTQDILKNALAFKGMSTGIFNTAISEVRELISRGSNIYPTEEYPQRGGPLTVTLRTEQGSSFVGRLAPAEAVAVRVLHTETAALLNSYAKSYEVTRKVEELTQTGEHAWTQDAVEAMIDFIHSMAMASGVRERVLNGQGEPAGTTINDHALVYWHKMFAGSLKQDGLTIGQHTAARIVEQIKANAVEDIADRPGGARNEAEKKARVAGRIRGAELARALYLETVNLAAQILPATIVPDKVIGKLVTRR